MCLGMGEYISRRFDENGYSKGPGNNPRGTQSAIDGIGTSVPDLDPKENEDIFFLAIKRIVVLAEMSLLKGLPRF
jgi:hypothetical protein